MKTILKLSHQILIAVALLTIALLLFTFSHNRQIKYKDDITREISANYQPSISLLTELSNLYEESVKITLYWGISGPESDAVFEQEMTGHFQNKIGSVMEQLGALSINWNTEDRELLTNTFGLLMDSLYYNYIDLINQVRIEQQSSSESPGIQYYLEQGDIIYLMSEIEQNLSYLLDKRRLEMNSAFNRIENSAGKINKAVFRFDVLFLLALYILAFLFIWYIKRSVSALSGNIGLLTQGVIPDDITIKRNNEFGQVYR